MMTPKSYKNLLTHPAPQNTLLSIKSDTKPSKTTHSAPSRALYETEVNLWIHNSAKQCWNIFRLRQQKPFKLKVNHLTSDRQWKKIKKWTRFNVGSSATTY